MLLDAAAPVSRFGVTHDLARIAGRLEIMRNDFVERCSLRTGNLDNAVSRRRECHLSDNRSNVVGRYGLEQAGRKPDYFTVPA